jgi:photosystem II stability/assembly factor-like uncharacterized protein
MKKIIYTLLTFVICSLLSAICEAQWVQQYSPVTTSLLDVSFINQNTGWASGDYGVILKTTNGGINWIQQNSGSTNHLEGIHAVDANTVYCVGWWQTILKTTNGGNSWLAIRNGTTNTVPSFFGVYFLNAYTGWLLRNNYILRTINGGSTFDSTYEVFSYMYDIFFKDASTGVLCGDGSLIMKSTDGGVIWNQITIPRYQGGMPNLYRESFVGNCGWVIGEGRDFNLGCLCWKTTNFGDSWDTISRIPYPNSELNYSVYFSSLNTGWAGGTSGYIFKSTNGGLNWIQQVSPSNGFRNDFWFFNDFTGWCVGGGGQIFKTTNGGTYVDIKPISNIIPKELQLYQNFPNPFNNQTIIIFEILKSDRYKMEVYDILGRKLEVIFDQYLMPGKFKIDYNAISLSSGTYFYRLSSSYSNKTKKFILIK